MVRAGMTGGLLMAWLVFGQAMPDGGRYPSPVDLALSPDGARLYIVCEGTDELVVADTATFGVVARVRVGHVPRGIALSTDGKRIYVTNSWADSVSEIKAEAPAV